MIYFAEFAYSDTLELAGELLIYADSDGQAKDFAHAHAAHWGIHLMSFAIATELQIRHATLLNKVVVLNEMAERSLKPLA
jgi:hypothetical protein